MEPSNQLKGSGDYFRLLITAPSDMVYRMSADWKYMYQLDGKNILADTDDSTGDWTEKYILPQERELVWRTISEAINSQTIFELEHRVYQADGDIGWVHSKAVPVINNSGEITEWLGSGSDITQRKHAEQILNESKERQVFLLQLSDALREIAEPGEIQKTATRMLGERLVASRVFYVIVDEDGDTADIIGDYTNGVPRRTGRYSLSAFSKSALAEWRAGRTASTSDVDSDPLYNQAEREAYAAVSTRAGVGIPLVKKGKLEAILGLNQSTPREWTKKEIELASEVAERTWEAVARAKAEKALRECEEKYRTLFTTIDGGFCIFELIYDEAGQAVDWIYTEANPAFERQTGYINAVGKKISKLQPDLERSWFDQYAGVARSVQPLRFERYTSAMNIWYDVYAMPVGPPGSNRVSLLFTNITERKQAEERQAAELADVKQLQLISSQLIQEDNIDELYGELIDAAMRIMHSQAASLQMYVRDNEALLLLASKGFASQSVSFWEWVDCGSNSTCGIALAEQRRFIVPDVDSTTAMAGTDDLKAYHSSNIRSVQSTPLVSRKGTIVGMISTHWQKVHQPSERELRLFDVLARQAADLIERKQAEQALIQSEKRLHAIANLVPDLLWDSAADGSTTWYNDRWLEYTGQRFEQAIGWGWLSVIHPDDREGSVQRHAKAVEEGKPLQQEHRIRRHDGMYRWFMVKASPVFGDNSRVIRMYGAATDIHDRITAEEKIRAHEKNNRIELEQLVADRTKQLHEQYALQQTMLDTTLIGMSVFEPVRNVQQEITDFRIVMVNKKVERSAGRNDMTGKLYAELFPGIWQMGLFDAMVKAMETGETQQLEYHYIYEGFDRWYSTMFIRGEDILVSTNLDITDQKLAEHKMRELEDAQQLEIFRVTLRTQEEERRRISESLHNGLGQMLYGIKMSLTQLKASKAQRDAEQYEQDRQYTSQLVSDAIRDSRRISHELMPQVLNEFGLKAAVEETCRQMQDGIHFDCRIELKDVHLDKYLELAVFRTLQELMLNVVKHAQASEARVEVLAPDGHILVCVSDNGRGISDVKSGKDGIGLASIRSKVDLLDGTFEVESAPGKGTTVSVLLPYKY